jgi:lipoprotein NlpI
VDARSNLPSRFAQAVTQLDMTRWPAPVIRLYLGQMTPEAVLAAADDPDADTRQRRVCEANFFIGQMALRRSAKDDAVRLFRLVASDCRKNANAWTQANAELKALGVPP